MKRWIGRWILGVGVVHTLFGLVVFRGTWQTLWAEGLFNTVNGQPEREFPVWFLSAGILTMLFGSLVDWVEGQGWPVPRSVAWGLLGMTVLILVIMPVSGGWLLLPAVMGLFNPRT
ncbi:MAG: DUF6463 family protein [Acidobacteriota bacterium]|nr:DUF6463 family protein [Acidobacteriota bacterium]